MLIIKRVAPRFRCATLAYALCRCGLWLWLRLEVADRSTASRRTERPVRVEPGEEDSGAGRERGGCEAEHGVQPEVVAAGHDDIGHQERIGEERGPQWPRLDQHRQRPGEDQREADVHRWDCSERVEEGVTWMG